MNVRRGSSDFRIQRFDRQMSDLQYLFETSTERAKCKVPRLKKIAAEIMDRLYNKPAKTHDEYVDKRLAELDNSLLLDAVCE